MAWGFYGLCSGATPIFCGTLQATRPPWKRPPWPISTGPADDREAARNCKQRVQQMLIGTKLRGFSMTAMAWSMLGALSNMNRQMAFANLPPKRAKREADEYMKDLIMALNHARRTTVN